GLREIGIRINRCSVQTHLIVEMGSRCPPGRSRFGDYLAPAHFLPSDNFESRKMSVVGLKSVSMIDDNQPPVTAKPSGMNDHPVGSDVNRRSHGSGEIDARVHGAFA